MCFCSAWFSFPAGWIQSPIRRQTCRAFRHCYWSGLMTLHLSEDAALRIAHNHEDVWPNDPGEAEMDVFNNAAGRAIGLMIKGKEGMDKGIAYVCKDMANASLLETLPK
ncbi:DUF6973 domain-containing protein [Corynebacterium pseudodiphtheriticum]|uniref:DUF6973 domain-containing protein n=1 Tax=Corynebacterium pseudodiphtheriticum TaxID=37637 RepID=UPI003D7532CD